MQLHIRQRIFSWTDSYDVFDATGEAKYEVRAALFALGHQIHVYDKRAEEGSDEIGCIRQKLFTLMPTFEIEINGRIVGTIKREFTFFKPRYHVDYRGWDVEGDFLEWDYRVLQGNMEVMNIEKKWLSWGDTYTLRYDNPANEMPGLLLVLAIDAANCDNN